MLQDVEVEPAVAADPAHAIHRALVSLPVTAQPLPDDCPSAPTSTDAEEAAAAAAKGQGAVATAGKVDSGQETAAITALLQPTAEEGLHFPAAQQPGLTSLPQK